ncbi:hypothetical protein AYK25_06350 [Thermoplasmatales archaeon SM1-50]|nr:MAG: hypothetical protein AYK25_06350 [Thermoplasmatales archaeon SM1-50]
MKNSRNNVAVSELVGEVLLLAIAVTSISVIYTQVLSTPGPVDTANATIVGTIEGGRPVFELQRGESLGADTKIFLTLAGYDKREFSTGELSNQEWTIGEQVMLPVEDVTGIRVDATIVDANTNTIVFWGRLQDGFTTTRKGGIWHFDEDLWRRAITDEVKDSSGNNNHGISFGGAKIINGTLQPSNVKVNNSGYFNGFMDTIRVKTSWTLNITNQITIEAWMKPQIPQFVADIGSISSTFGYTPYIIHLFDNNYVYISEEAQKGCHISTVEIDPYDGNISTHADYVLTEVSTGSNICQPKIVQITENFYVVSFIDFYYHLNLQTISISPDYSINVVNKFVFPEECSRNKRNSPSLLKITDNVCAIAYWTPTDGGILRTVEISETGKITYKGKSITYDPASSGIDPREPYLAYVMDDTYILAYRDPSAHGILKTFIITSTGNISYTGNMVEFDSAAGYEPSLAQVSENIFAVAYRGINNWGYVKTFDISSNGSLVWTGQTRIFEQSEFCFNPWIIYGEDDMYIIAYSAKNNAKGYVSTVRIDEDGIINPMVILRKQFFVIGPNPEVCFFPIIIRVGEQLYAISFTGANHQGYLITIMIGPHGRGIYKGNSYLLYANTTSVEACINDVYLYYYDTSFGLGWNHFAVTYNGTSICLYVNGNKVNEKSYPNHRIDLTRSPLFIGRFFCGFMDEVAIYDEALTQEQILNHYVYPGMFE